MTFTFFELLHTFSRTLTFGARNSIQHRQRRLRYNSSSLPHSHTTTMTRSNIYYPLASLESLSFPISQNVAITPLPYNHTQQIGIDICL